MEMCHLNEANNLRGQPGLPGNWSHPETGLRATTAAGRPPGATGATGATGEASRRGRDGTQERGGLLER